MDGTYIGTDDAEVWEGDNIINEDSNEPEIKADTKRYSIVKMLELLETLGKLDECLAE